MLNLPSFQCVWSAFYPWSTVGSLYFTLTGISTQLKNVTMKDKTDTNGKLFDWEKRMDNERYTEHLNSLTNQNYSNR